MNGMEPPKKIEQAQIENAPEKSSLSSLSNVRDLGRIKDTSEVIKGHTVTLETLSVGEQDTVLGNLPDSLPTFQRFHRLQVYTLTYATREYNGERITDDNRDMMYNFYSGLQDKLLSEFYDFYLDLVERQNDVIKELKKK